MGIINEGVPTEGVALNRISTAINKKYFSFPSEQFACSVGTVVASPPSPAGAVSASTVNGIVL